VGQQTGSPVGQAKLQARGIECKIERMKGRRKEEGKRMGGRIGRGRVFYVETTEGQVIKQRIMVLNPKRQN
jgi:hypothetical protein